MTFHIREDNAPDVVEAPGFTPALVALFEQFNTLGASLLEATALRIGLPINHLRDQMGNSLLRAAYYPGRPDEGDAVICGARHRDINMLTILLAQEEGLELEYEGRMIPVTITDPNALVVNCALMLEHLTNGRFRAGWHQVRRRAGVSRR